MEWWLAVSNTNIDKNRRIIVFAPHPDDETLGCGGTIAKKLVEGYEVIIVVMTDGRFLLLRSFGIDDDPTPEQVKDIRRGEVLRATKILGVPENNVIFLDFVDGTLKENEEAAEEKVAKILKKCAPSEVYFPFERDAHPDHQAANRILRKAVEKLAIKPMIYRYTIMHKAARFGPLIEFLASIFKRDRIYVDVSEFLPLKREAVKEFKSELTAISPKQSKPHTKEFKKFLKRKEMFYVHRKAIFWMYVRTLCCHVKCYLV
jgi:LmbE family N-acetylglucosaminyl deacetylase